MANSNPLSKRWPVELKVRAMTVGTAAISAVIAILNDVQADNSLIPGPSWFQAGAIVVIPTAINFLTGYNTRHSSREIQ